MTDELSTSRQPDSLPERVIERVFAQMLMTYGKRYTDQWGATDPAALRRYWAEQLAGFSGDELARGLAALSNREWPPTLPEFKRLCRPPVDPQAAFYEAVAGMQARERGEPFAWSNPAIYWAAVKVGAFDIKNGTFSQLQDRWKTALEAFLAEGRCLPIPDPVKALPAPGKAALSRESAARLLAEYGAASVLRPNPDPRAWIRRVRERVEAGEAVPLAVIKAAEAAERGERETND